MSSLRDRKAEKRDGTREIRRRNLSYSLRNKREEVLSRGSHKRLPQHGQQQSQTVLARQKRASLFNAIDRGKGREHQGRTPEREEMSLKARTPLRTTGKQRHNRQDEPASSRLEGEKRNQTMSLSEKERAA